MGYVRFKSKKSFPSPLAPSTPSSPSSPADNLRAESRFGEWINVYHMFLFLESHNGFFRSAPGSAALFQLALARTKTAA
jgi:hypothetical protein